tara:strand:+ start:186 stop:524 length:339 start_codon:yes stop_codon:yes gene_type:complete
MAAVFVSNLIVNSGSTFKQTFDLAKADDSGPLNLDNATVTSQFRKHAGSTSKHDFTTTKDTENQGKVTISLTATQSAVPKPGRYVYDIVITEGSEITRVVEGSVLIREGVTR